MNLNTLEKEVLKTLWRLKKAFPKEIMESLPKPTPPYNTVLSTVRNLEKKNIVDHKKFGKSHQYFPIISKKEYGKSMFTNLYHGLLGGSKESLLSYFLEEKDVNIAELEAIIQQMKNRPNE